MHCFERDVAEQCEPSRQRRERSRRQMEGRGARRGVAYGLQFRDSIAEPRHEISGWFDLREASHEHQPTPNSDVMSRAAITTLHVSTHPLHLHRWKRVIDKADVFLSELATIHQKQCARMKQGPRLGTRHANASSEN
jgi:hypothetical protein